MSKFETYLGLFGILVIGFMITWIIATIYYTPQISELEVENLYYKTKWERCEQGYETWIKVDGEYSSFRQEEVSGTLYLILESECDTLILRK